MQRLGHHLEVVEGGAAAALCQRIGSAHLGRHGRHQRLQPTPIRLLRAQGRGLNSSVMKGTILMCVGGGNLLTQPGCL